MRHPRWGELRDFCRIDGWEPIKAPGRRKREDHYRYRKTLDDGRVLRTRASHGNDQIGDPKLWRHIWRDQLGLDSEERFWEALRTGEPVDRAPSEPPAEPPIELGPRKPGWLVQALLGTVGLSEEEVAGMTEEEALQRWIDFCARG